MSELSIPSEFDLELQSERGRWLRRRLLWLCAVGILLTVIADAAEASHHFAYATSERRFAGWVSVAVGAFNVLLYAGAGLYAGLWNVRERRLQDEQPMWPVKLDGVSRLQIAQKI